MLKDINKLKNQLESVIEGEKQWAWEMSREIFNHPELSDKEYYSSSYISKQMEDKGFDVKIPYANLQTAFRCDRGKGKFNIAFLAEYDALPGYGKNHNEVKHTCGHNWIAASTALAAVGLSKVMGDEICVSLIGTPGEEETGRKIDMAREGIFKNLDGAFQIHLDRNNCVNVKTLAMTDFVFEFSGRAAHAAGCPECGINALDACELTKAGINAMRQQLPPEVKIHSVYLDGGKMASVIPEHASICIYIRDKDKDRLEKIIKRVINIGKGAELMTGATFSYTRAKNTYFDLKNDIKLQRYMEKNLNDLGVHEFVAGDVLHAVSSDIGNVSYECPTCYCNLGTSHISDALIHEEAFSEVAISSEANDLLVVAAKAMSKTALDLWAEKNK